MNDMASKHSRRQFLQTSAALAAWVVLGGRASGAGTKKKPNVIYVFPDQWRAQATGYNGDENAHTPNLDRLARESIDCSLMVSGYPVCSPYRASLLTGQYPLTHGVFINDKPLGDQAVSLAQAFKAEGYDTAYIGKWHLDGRGRDTFIPPERRQGFDFWRAAEATHDYNNSLYYADTDKPLYWDGYDAISQTKEAERYIRDHPKDKPFLLVLSWGPPHEPYDTAPEKFKGLVPPEDEIKLRPNVPRAQQKSARRDLAGYYAHIAALDECLGDLLRTIDDAGIREDTIFVFTSDHGDMLGSQGEKKKQKPWDESILVPFLLRWPALKGSEGREIDQPINAPDIMPTLCGLAGIPVPATVQGEDFSSVLRGEREPWNDAALISCPIPSQQWSYRKGGREYRGVRTRRYTYVRDLNGPWLLYDNEKDPFQRRNLVGDPAYKEVQSELETILQRKLKQTGDTFEPGHVYAERWGYDVRTPKNKAKSAENLSRPNPEGKQGTNPKVSPSATEENEPADY